MLGEGCSPRGSCGDLYWPLLRSSVNRWDGFKKPETLLYFCLISQESQIGILSLYNSNSWKCTGLKCIFFKKATLIAILEVYEALLFAGCILYDLSLNGTRNSELPTYLLLNILVHCRAFCCCSFASLFFSPLVSYLFDKSPLIIFLP